MEIRQGEDQDSDGGWSMDIDPLPEQGTAKPATATSSPASTAPSAPARRRPIPSKGHRKSRRGCYSCKRRKVKCSEEQPVCADCGRMGFVCEYPPLSAALPSQLGVGPLSSASAPNNLAYEDLRFFFHLLTAVFPAQPNGMNSGWMRIAAMSHEVFASRRRINNPSRALTCPQFDYLAHALLGQGAQHLTICAAGAFSVQAIHHRVTAIRLLNQALGRPPASPAERNARFAAAIALTYQSAYMPEGMMEFLSTMRGWNMMEESDVGTQDSSFFSAFTEDSYQDGLKRMLVTPVGGDKTDMETLLEAVSGSIGEISPRCPEGTERRYALEIERWVALAQTSPTDGEFPSH